MEIFVVGNLGVEKIGLEIFVVGNLNLLVWRSFRTSYL